MTKDTALLNKIKERFSSAEASLAKYRDDSAFPWTEREALLLGVNQDKISSEVKSQVNTQDLQNLVLDGASRVMAQIPTGKVQAFTQDDAGKNVLMNLVLDKHVLENIHSAMWPWLIKFRVWDMYSRIYGAMPMLATWRVDKNYVGPDGYLLNPRSFRPQAGKVTIQECDYVFVDSWVSIAWLGQRNKEIWQNIPELIKEAKDKMNSKASASNEDLTYTEQLQRDGFSGESGKYGQVLLRTQYEKDRWITYAPEHDIIIRNIKNQNGDDEIPVVMKQCFPLMDRIYGLGEFERGKTLAYAINSLVNLYMDGVKMSIFPPLILNQNGIVASSIKYQPGAKWLEKQANAIRQLQLSPQGMQTFQSTYGFLKAALLNMGATTDTSVSKDTDPGFGKTPSALQMQGAREGARDNWDRHMMETAISELFNRFVNMFPRSQEKPIKLDIFKKEIEKIQNLYPNENIVEVFNSGEAGRATIGTDTFKENGDPINFRFYIDPGTTMKKDDAIENQTIGNLMALVLKNPMIIQALEMKGQTVDIGEMFKRYLITSGTQDWDKIIIQKTETPEGEPGIGPDSATIPEEIPQELPVMPQVEQETADMMA
jgi:hypothetical protein